MTQLNPQLTIQEWQPDTSGAPQVELDMLAEILHAVVHHGASVNFFLPFSIDDARSFWAGKILPQVRTGTRRVLLARVDGRIVGTVQMDLDTPSNQPHRALVEKVLVHPEAQRRGIARALMLALEELARTEGRTLLTLDTVTNSAAQSLYQSLGYTTVGMIPGYARGALTPELESTTIMYKKLA
jgi:ribosomal protein S18 acetylase RimI-like enzyme